MIPRKTPTRTASHSPVRPRQAGGKHGLAILLAAFLAAAPALAGPKDEGGGYLGIRLQRLEGGLAEALDLEEDSGVLVGQVFEGSPAEEAGLEAGDIILRIDDDDVGTPSALHREVRDHGPGDVVAIRLLRDGDRRTVSVTLGEAPPRGGHPHHPRHGANRRVRRYLDMARDLRFHGEHGFLGVISEPLRGDLGDYFGVESGEGALVTEVVEDSPAEKLGLKAGDVILEIDGRGIDDPGELRKVIRDHEEEEEIEVVWVRDRKEKHGKTTLELRENRPLPGPGFRGDGPHGFGFDVAPRLEALRRHTGDEEFFLEKRKIREGVHDAIEELREQLEHLRQELDDLKENAD